MPLTRVITQEGLPLDTLQAGRTPLGYEERAVGITAVALAAVPATATIAFMSVEATVASGVSETLRFRVDGGAATATSGHELEDRERVVLDNRTQLTNFRIIRDSAATADGKISVTYF